MNIKSILTGVKSALRLSAVIGCVVFVINCKKYESEKFYGRIDMFDDLVFCAIYDGQGVVINKEYVKALSKSCSSMAGKVPVLYPCPSQDEYYITYFASDSKYSCINKQKIDRDEFMNCKINTQFSIATPHCR